MERLGNWGNYPVLECEVSVMPADPENLVRQTGPVIARGMGRSYGDASLGKKVIQMTGRNCMLDFDKSSGILTAESGVTLSEILEVFVPRGWFLPVTPGTRLVTLGGAVAADVHGKNHHSEGSFCDHVVWIDLLLENGSVIRCSGTEHPEIFHATRGGMGLTGIILKVAFRLKKIETAWMRQTTVKVRNFREMCALFEEYKSATYSVAWVDCLAKGKDAGRGLLMLGEHATREEVQQKGIKTLFTGIRKPGPSVPFFLPGFVLNRLSIRLFNLLFYHKQLRRVSEQLTPFESYFYPLDVIGNWNRIYGRRGFVQYQFVLPFTGGAEAMQDILETIADRGFASFLSVLKVFGPQEGLMAFPMEGYTLALDFPADPDLIEFLTELDAKVLKAGGRLYLAKDARMSAEMMAQSYPDKLALFRKSLQNLAPKGFFQSALSQRLHLHNRYEE